MGGGITVGRGQRADDVRMQRLRYAGNDRDLGQYQLSGSSRSILGLYSTATCLQASSGGGNARADYHGAGWSVVLYLLAEIALEPRARGGG